MSLMHLIFSSTKSSGTNGWNRSTLDSFENLTLVETKLVVQISFNIVK